LALALDQCSINATYTLRSSLTHVKLDFLRNNLEALDGGGLSGNYLFFLSHFKNLTHLYIRNSKHTGFSNLSLQAILKECPKLTNLTLHSHLPILDIALIASSPFDDTTIHSFLLFDQQQQAKTYDTTLTHHKRFSASQILMSSSKI
jgi:hypothetical protein